MRFKKKKKNSNKKKISKKRGGSASSSSSMPDEPTIKHLNKLNKLAESIPGQTGQTRDLIETQIITSLNALSPKGKEFINIGVKTSSAFLIPNLLNWLISIGWLNILVGDATKTPLFTLNPANMVSTFVSFSGITIALFVVQIVITVTIIQVSLRCIFFIWNRIAANKVRESRLKKDFEIYLIKDTNELALILYFFTGEFIYKFPESDLKSHINSDDFCKSLSSESSKPNSSSRAYPNHNSLNLTLCEEYFKPNLIGQCAIGNVLVTFG